MGAKLPNNFLKPAAQFDSPLRATEKRTELALVEEGAVAEISAPLDVSAPPTEISNELEPAAPATATQAEPAASSPASPIVTPRKTKRANIPAPSVAAEPSEEGEIAHRFTVGVTEQQWTSLLDACHEYRLRERRNASPAKIVRMALDQWLRNGKKT